MFIQERFPVNVLPVEDTDEGRFYETPLGRLPSVTTVLDKHADKSGLESWKEYIDKRDGEGTADGIVTQSSRHGNAVHKMAEDYLNNVEDWRNGHMPINIGSFLKIKGILDANVKKVYGLEHAVYSGLLRTAGRVDIIADWNSYPTVLDLKTSRVHVRPDNPKLIKWQLQATAYSMILEERYRRPFEQCIILTMIGNEIDPQLFIFNNEEYRDRVRKIFTTTKVTYAGMA